jgi:hypothetical protein
LTPETDFSEGKEYNVYWDGDHEAPMEYAVYGWVKQNAVVSGDEEQVIFRFTTNTDENLGDAETLGDRGLVLSVTEGHLIAYTYSYDILY